MDTTTQLEMVNVKVKKNIDVTMGNQHPRSVQDKVQRLSGSAEYSQVAGKSGQPNHSCKDCGETAINEFGKRSDNGKFYNFCRKCRQDRNRATQQKYSKRPDVKAKKAVHDKKYAKTNKTRIAKYQKEYQEANRANLIIASRERYLKNRDRHLEQCKQWKKNNRGRVNNTCMKRHASKIQQIPKWHGEYEEFLMVCFYDQSRDISVLTGVKHHVDHIYPLQGKTVSGLHTPLNMQVLTASANCSKQNKVDNIV